MNKFKSELKKYVNFEIENKKDFAGMEKVYDSVAEIYNFIIALKDKSDVDVEKSLKECIKENTAKNDLEAENFIKDKKIVEPIKELLTKHNECLELVSDKTPQEENYLLGQMLWDFNTGGSNNLPRMQCIAINGYIIGNTEQITQEKESGTEVNQRSLAFLIEFGNFRYYTGGDIGQAQEEKIAAYLKKHNKQLDAFKVSHHGSEHSTPLSLCQQAKKGCVAFISRGWENPFDHVRYPAYDNLKKSNIQCYLTGFLDKRNTFLHKMKDLGDLQRDGKISSVCLDRFNQPRLTAPGSLVLTVRYDDANPKPPDENVKKQIAFDALTLGDFKVSKEEKAILITQQDMEDFLFTISQPTEPSLRSKRKRGEDIAEAAKKMIELAKTKVGVKLLNPTTGKEEEVFLM
ncbi:MAG: hypothetical protein ACKO80_07250, partial [Acidimicrobiaceae bacterium]